MKINNPLQLKVPKEMSAVEALIWTALRIEADARGSSTFIFPQRLLYESLNLSKTTYFRAIKKLSALSYIKTRAISMGPRNSVHATRFEVLIADVTSKNTNEETPETSSSESQREESPRISELLRMYHQKPPKMRDAFVKMILVKENINLNKYISA